MSSRRLPQFGGLTMEGVSKMRERLRIIVPLLLVLVLALVALAGCQQGGTGGEDENQQEGGGQQQEQGLELEVVKQWVESGHARPITFAAEEEGCKNCHDGQTFSETGGGFQPRMSVQTTEAGGEGDDEATGTAGTDDETGTASEEGTGAAGEEEEQERDWVVATDCRACHTGAGAQIAEEGSVEGIPNLETAEGGQGALCMACHNGWHPPGVSRGEPTAPHYSTQTDMMYAVNTLDPGASQGATGGAGQDTTGTGESTGTAGQGDEEMRSPHLEVRDTCVGCHVAGGDNANHRFEIEDFEGCQREGCHEQDMTDGGDAEEDYDGDGRTEKVTAEVEGLMDTLEQEIIRSAGITSFESAQGQVLFKGGRLNANGPEYAAAYNYLYVDKDGSRGIHNTQFTVQLLQDSIEAVSR